MTYILLIAGAVLTLAARLHVNRVYKKYSKTANSRGVSGLDTAKKILNYNSIYDVTVLETPEHLGDHYTPGKSIVYLSTAVYKGNSIASAAIAAHECGHVCQHKFGYTPLRIRTALVPVANIGSNLGIWIAIFGLVFGLSDTFINVGIILFSCAVAFQLITLPVEFNASNRAVHMLSDYGILESEDIKPARKVLRAAALTYVAAAASSIFQLLRLIILRDRR